MDRLNKPALRRIHSKCQQWLQRQAVKLCKWSRHGTSVLAELQLRLQYKPVIAVQTQRIPPVHSLDCTHHSTGTMWQCCRCPTSPTTAHSSVSLTNSWLTFLNSETMVDEEQIKSSDRQHQKEHTAIKFLKNHVSQKLEGKIQAFYRQDAFLSTQPTVSKHERNHKSSGLDSHFFFHHRTPEERSVATFTLALQHQWKKTVNTIQSNRSKKSSKRRNQSSSHLHETKL